MKGNRYGPGAGSDARPPGRGDPRPWASGRCDHRARRRGCQRIGLEGAHRSQVVRPPALVRSARGSAAGEISGIVDWDNARRGHPLLDVARTHAILTVEPALASLPAEVRAQLQPFHDGWTLGYGPEAEAIPAACLAWAGRVMLADLEPRYAGTPQDLEAVRRWTENWARRAAG